MIRVPKGPAILLGVDGLLVSGGEGGSHLDTIVTTIDKPGVYLKDGLFYEIGYTGAMRNDLRVICQTKDEGLAKRLVLQHHVGKF